MINIINLGEPWLLLTAHPSLYLPSIGEVADISHNYLGEKSFFLSVRVDEVELGTAQRYTENVRHFVTIVALLALNTDFNFSLRKQCEEGGYL